MKLIFCKIYFMFFFLFFLTKVEGALIEELYEKAVLGSHVIREIDAKSKQWRHQEAGELRKLLTFIKEHSEKDSKEYIHR